jgi:hypothetical protein
VCVSTSADVAFRGKLHFGVSDLLVEHALSRQRCQLLACLLHNAGRNRLVDRLTAIEELHSTEKASVKRPGDVLPNEIRLEIKETQPKGRILTLDIFNIQIFCY